MTHYNAHYEFDGENLTEDRAIQIMDDLAGLNPAVGSTPSGRLSVRITFPADDIRGAQKLGLEAVVSAVAGRSIGVHAGSMPIVAEVMTEQEWDAREGHEHVPEMMSVTELANEYGVSRQAALKMITGGRFAHITRVGEAWAVLRSEVLSKRDQYVAPTAPTDRREGESPEEFVDRVTSGNSSAYPAQG
jgi:hypothetical protein